MLCLQASRNYANVPGQKDDKVKVIEPSGSQPDVEGIVLS